MTDYAATCRDFDWDLPERFNFAADVVDLWARDANRLALVWCNAAGEERRFTYAEMSTLAARFAGVLAAAGVAKGDRVIVMLPRIPEWQVAMVGCLRIGAVPVPCVGMLTARDLAYRLEHSGARAVITTTGGVARMPRTVAAVDVRIAVGGADGWIDWRDAMAAAEPAPAAVVELEDPAIMYYTSGTSGKPKGVVHASRALFAWRYTGRYWLDLDDGDLMWCTADTGWSKAGTSILFGPWSAGVPVLFHDGPFDAHRRLDLLARYGVTVFCAAATELRQLVFEDVGAHDLSRLRRTVSAGETLNPEVAERWSALTGAPCHEGYGQTESLMSVHTYPCTPAKAGSAGLPLPGYIVAILDETGRPLPAGEAGILAIRMPNPNMLLGYWGEPGRVERELVANDAGTWFLTGDAAHVDADGYVFTHGRADDIINSAGYRIGPVEVENALMEHPAVRECAAVGSPDPDRGEVVKAFVVLAPGRLGSESLARELQEHCKAVTAPYKYPRRIAFVEDLPKNAAGKLLRAELRAQERTARAASSG
ncbi:MAG: AMP-binding protein [Ectothiorhodospiraceae bacterium]|nr:AMP-binding protein [Planctomycetota bacterium]MCP5154256.1 AMP-binding protein [Ectothiorhodospiraceae bacterium]